MKIHELKILPEYYDAVRFGDKRFEIRKNDRDFHSGDILRLKEWDGQQFTGEELDVIVRYVYYGIDEYGLAEGYCIMSIDTMMHSIPKERQTRRVVDVNELIDELGFNESCTNCKRDTRKCGCDYCYSLMDFCGMLDDAIEAIEKKHKNMK